MYLSGLGFDDGFSIPYLLANENLGATLVTYSSFIEYFPGPGASDLTFYSKRPERENFGAALSITFESGLY